MLKERAQGDCPRVSIRTLAPPQALQIPGQQLDNLAAGNVKRHDEGNGDGGMRDFLCLPKYHRQPVKEEVYVRDTM